MSNGTCMHIKSRLIVAGRQEKVHARQIDRSDHLGSVSRLEPTDRRVIDSVGKRNLAQRLASCHTLQGFARLMLGQLRLPAKSYAFGHGASAAFVSPLQDQAAL